MKHVGFRRAARAGAMLCCFGLLVCCGCPVYRLTGIPCPGCGLTRAWRCFLMGEWQLAVRYHPLFLPAPLFLIAAAAGDLPGLRDCRWRRRFCAGYAALLLGVYWARIGGTGML